MGWLRKVCNHYKRPPTPVAIGSANVRPGGGPAWLGYSPGWPDLAELKPGD
jgi:hypothetical protein